MGETDQLLDNGNTKGNLNKELSDETASHGEKKAKKEYTLYPLRWFIIIFFTTSVVSSGLGMVAFTPISKIIKETYGVSDLITTMLVLPYTILFIPFIFPANSLIESKGISVPVYVATA
jgi:hypothetical protein